MFEIGEYVVYGTEGVCTVESIGALDIEGVSKDKMFYTLVPIGRVGNNRIFAPVDGTRIVMRKVLTSDEAHELIRGMDKIERLEIENERKREETYKSALQSCDCRRIAQLIREIYFRKQERDLAGKKLPSVDERYFNIAENYLFSELSIPLKIDKSEVRDYIAGHIGKKN